MKYKYPDFKDQMNTKVARKHRNNKVAIILTRKSQN